jgi:hypothetical protein
MGLFSKSLALIGLFTCLPIGLSGCQPAAIEGEGLEIGGSVQLLTAAQGELAERAMRRLQPHGRTALPYLEAALHHAPPAGRRHLVIAIRRIGLAESAPLLGQVAAFDEDPDTVREAWGTLSVWAGERVPRGAWARAALRKVDEIRGMEVLLFDP